MDRKQKWKMELEPKKNLGGYANSILCVGALSSLISSFALSGAEDTLASAHAAGAFWIFLALFVSCLLYTTQRAFSGNMMNTGVYMGLTLLTCGALASTCFVDANSVDLQTAVTIAGFAGPALVMMFVLMRVSLACQGKNNRMARFTNSKQFIAFGIYATAIVSTFVGGALFMSYSPEGITNFSGDYCLAVAFGLLFSVFIFYQCGSRNAGDDQFFQKGLFNANYSRVALTVFWTLSSAALGSTFLCSVFDGGSTAFVPFQCSAGIAAVLFSIMYCLFFNWQNGDNYNGCEGIQNHDHNGDKHWVRYDLAFHNPGSGRVRGQHHI